MESSNQGTEDGTNPRQQILEKEAIKKTTARTKIRILIETLEKKIHQKKLSSHRNIKKSTRRKDIAINFSVYFYRIDVLSYNC